MTAEYRQNRAQDVFRFQANDEGQRLKAKHDPVEARAALLVACSFASDADEARLLLDMLGLLPEGVTAPGARAATWMTGWEGK